LNECSTCGTKVSDDDCVNAPITTLCAIDGFETSTRGYTSDVLAPTLGFCGGGTQSHNNLWIGFIATETRLELMITSSNCLTPNNSRGIQVAIVETDCSNSLSVLSAEGQPACYGALLQGGLFNNSTVLRADNLILGNPYYIMVDGFAGGECDVRIDILSEIENPDLEIQNPEPVVLCSDQTESSATVLVNVGGLASTDLTFFWLNPSGDLIASNAGEVLNSSLVRGSLDANFFNEAGIYTVEITDSGSCCPVCTEIAIDIGNSSNEASVNITGGQDIRCVSDIVIVQGNPIDGSVPALESWTIVDDDGNRNLLAQSIVSTNGRLNEFEITRDIVAENFPNRILGNAEIIYGFISNINDACFSENSVSVPFNFTDTSMDCLFNSIDNSLLDGIEIHPNPTIDILHINHIANEIVGLNIIDKSGRIIEQIDSNSRIQLDVSHYINGVYAILF